MKTSITDVLKTSITDDMKISVSSRWSTYLCCASLIEPLALNVLFNPLEWKFIGKFVDNMKPSITDVLKTPITDDN